MDLQRTTSEPSEAFCTLLGVRPDGVAPVVDLMPLEELHDAPRRAQRLLNEHASCEAVEVWRGGALLQRHLRT